MPTVNVISPSHTIFAGSSPSFTCSLKFDNTVDVLLQMFEIIFTPLDGDSIHSNETLHADNSSYYTRTFTIDSVQESDHDKQYMCVAMVSQDSVTPFIFTQMLDIEDNVTLHICECQAV